jgi:hypothetical protein
MISISKLPNRDFSVTFLKIHVLPLTFNIQETYL